MANSGVLLLLAVVLVGLHVDVAGEFKVLTKSELASKWFSGHHTIALYQSLRFLRICHLLE